MGAKLSILCLSGLILVDRVASLQTSALGHKYGSWDTYTGRRLIGKPSKGYPQKILSIEASRFSDIATLTSKLERKLLGNGNAIPDTSTLSSNTASKADKSINIFDDITNAFDSSITSSVKDLIESTWKNIETQLNGLVALPSNILPTDMSTRLASLERDLIFLLSIINEKRYYDGVEYSIAQVMEASVALLVISAIINNSDDDGEPYGVYEKYNATLAAKYYGERPFLVLSRSLQLFSKSSTFAWKLFLNYVTNKMTDPTEEAKRAEELAQLLNELGPTFIKIGQSLSIRTDLLRPAYIKSLSQLQDRVPSFPTLVAKEIITREFRKPVSELFSSGLEDSAQVVAAASLGQVFKATLKSDGSQVAVKVQRPNIIRNVALDMHILREIVPILKEIFKWDSDVLAIVDDWGVGFVNELDYYTEALNAQIFTNSIANTPLKDVVFAPEVISECSTKKVLTTRWVDGDRIEKSDKEEVTALCNIAMNTYLSMLLEMPILHCDPHPGNLRRTPDGRLCIMDWGLIQSIDPEIQTTLIAHISHLVGKDYAKVPSDLVKLGFVPAGKEQVVLDNGVVEVLADIYGRWATGGGVGSVDINSVINQLSGLTAKYGNLFQLPPYFAYIARAFSVLEGIGLSSDPKYSIVNECLPYISKRLLTDPNAKTAEALESFIFGPNNDENVRLIDVDRMKLLVQGFGKYSDAVDGLAPASSEQIGNGNVDDPEIIVDKIDDIADEILDVIFPMQDLNSTKSAQTPIQKIVLQELGKVVGASARLTFKRLRENTGKLPTGRSLIGSIIDPLGIFSNSNLIEMDEYDEKVLSATSTLFKELQNYLPISFQDILQKLTPAQLQSLTVSLASKIWTRRDQLQSASVYLLSQVLRQSADRVQRPGVNNSGNENISNQKISLVSKASSPSLNPSPKIQEVVPVAETPRVRKARELLAAARRDSI